MSSQTTHRWVFTFFAIFCLGANAGAQERVLNLDFGNGGQFVGDNGVLSTPGGTFWNEIQLQERDPSIGDILLGPAELLDEFGQSFGIGTPPLAGLALPEVAGGFRGQQATAVSTVGAGPLNDSIRTGEVGGFTDTLLIREISGPFDIVIYFNEPSSVQLNFNDPSLTGSVTSPVGFFPGIENNNFLRFDDVEPVPTTIGIPLLPGVFVGVSDELSTASIAAIQIRGEFTFTPEPSTATMVSISLLSLVGRRRRTKS